MLLIQFLSLKLILGAVTGLKNVLHPIAVARLVMERTPHVLLSGDGVQEFAQQHNIPLEESLHTKCAWDALEEFKKNKMLPTKMEIGYTYTFVCDCHFSL